MAARQVQQQGAVLHPRQLGRPDQSRVVGTAVNMQADHVALGQQGVERGHAAGVAERQSFGQIVENDPHAEPFRQHRQLRADGAIADDAQGLAAQLARAGRGLVPLAPMHGGGLVGDVAEQGDGQADGQFDHRAGVGIGGVEDRDAPTGGGVEIDLVGPDAEGGDGHQPIGGVEDAGADLGLGADAEHMDAPDGLDQGVLVQRALQGFHRVAGFLQPLDGGGMDVLEQQDADAATGVGPAARETLGVQELIHRRRFGVGGGDHAVAANHLGEGVEAVGGSGQADLCVGPAVADHDHGAGQAEGADDDGLSSGLRQGVGLVHAGDPALGVIG